MGDRRAGGEKLRDVIVIGGGMVGGTVASLLGRAGYSVTLVDNGPQPAWDPAAPVGLRVSALSPGSARILDAAGAWERIEAQRHCPYRRMHVEDGQGSGAIDFEAGSFGLERLGTITENALVVYALWQALAATKQVQCLSSTGLERLTQDADGVHCELTGGQRLSARLLLACDGAHSGVRQFIGMRGEAWEYNQLGVVGLVRKQLPNPGVAWQRFLAGGPLALLPLADGWSTMVWSLPAGEARRMLQMEDDAFRESLDVASDGWLGGVEEVGARAAFPLSMSLSDRYLAGRIALLGDAAHVVHPLAGQGVNLGLADAAALVECLLRTAGGGTAAQPRALQEWERWRRSETALMARGVDALGKLFRPQALALPRALGMRLVGRSWSLREAFLQRAAGQGPNAPRLARGEALAALTGE